MTTNQTIDGVPRDLFEASILCMEAADHIPAEWAKELRALLDAPAVLGEIDLTPKRLAHAEIVIEQQNNLIASLRAELVESYRVAAQPQGDPVAWLVQCRASDLFEQAEPNEKASNPEHWTDAFPVYREQSAPVAVVLPLRKPVTGTMEQKRLANEWNACVAEFEHINKSPI